MKHWPRFSNFIPSQRISLLFGFLSFPHFPLSGLACRCFFQAVSQSLVALADLDQTLPLFCLMPSLFLTHFHSPNDFLLQRITFSTLLVKLKLLLSLLPSEKKKKSQETTSYKTKEKAKQNEQNFALLCLTNKSRKKCQQSPDWKKFPLRNSTWGDKAIVEHSSGFLSVKTLFFLYPQTSSHRQVSAQTAAFPELACLFDLG